MGDSCSIPERQRGKPNLQLTLRLVGLRTVQTPDSQGVAPSLGVRACGSSVCQCYQRHVLGLLAPRLCLACPDHGHLSAAPDPSR